MENKHYKLQKTRFRVKRNFAKNDKAIHVGKPTRPWEISNVRKVIKNDKMICDLGSGICKFIFEVVKPYKGYFIAGVDCSPDLLEEAEYRYSKGLAGNNELILLEADYHNLPIFDNLFDTVVLRFSIHHSDKPNKLIEEAYRILKPGGKLIVIEVENFENRSAYNFFNLLNKTREPSDFKFYSKNQYIKLLRKKFKKDIDVMSKSYEMPLENWLSYYKSPEKTLRMFLNANDNIKKEFSFSSTGKIHTVKLSNLILVATK